MKYNIIYPVIGQALSSKFFVDSCNQFKSSKVVEDRIGVTMPGFDHFFKIIQTCSVACHARNQ